MRLDPTEHLPAPSDPPVTAHVAGRASTVHDDDAAWMARMKARENPKPPRVVTGPEFRQYADDYLDAELEHKEAQEALTLASERAIEASAKRQAAKAAYIRAAIGYKDTRERLRTQTDALAERIKAEAQPTDQVKKP